VVAGAAHQFVESSALATEDKDAIAGEIEVVVVGGAAFVETDDPHIAALKLFEGADEVDHAGNAEVFGGAGAGFDGDGADGCGAAFGEQDAVNAGAVGHTQQCAEVLGIFDTVKGQDQARCARDLRLEEVFDGEEFLGANECHDALMGGGSGNLGEVFARLLADADAGLPTLGNQAGEAVIFAFAGNEDVIKFTAARLERLFYRVNAVQNLHEG
jgi:hypothetical protein